VTTRSTLVLTFVAGLVMIVAAVGTRRLLTLTLALVALLVALSLPLTPVGNWLEPAALSIVFSIAALGVVVVDGWAGQLFLAPLALTGLGAYATAWFAGDQGQPLVIAITYAMALVVILGVVIGLACAVQRSGAAVAIVSLGLAGVLDAAVFHSHAIGGTRRLTPAVSHPLRMGSYQVDADVVLYYVLLLLLVICFLSVLVLRESRLRALLHASRTQTEAAVAGVRGVDVTATRFVAYLIASVLAGVAGCALAIDTGRVTPQGFAPLDSLLLVGLVLVLGRGRVTSAIPAGVVAGAVPELMSRYHPIAGYRPADLDLAVGALLLVVLVGRELLKGSPAWTRVSGRALPFARPSSRVRSASKSRLL
jgi:ABC-type branched-subunit amino acid transport system permease subunit